MRRVRPPAKLRQALRRAAERSQQLGRQAGVVENDVVMQRSVAEQHIDELAGVGADGRGGERDFDVEPAVAAILDPGHLADDVGEDRSLAHRRQRHFHALFDGDVARAGLDRARVAADAVGCNQSSRQSGLPLGSP